jgi:hypothetical protein
MTTLVNEENITNMVDNDNNNIDIKEELINKKQIRNKRINRFLANISNKLELSHVVNFK